MPETRTLKCPFCNAGEIVASYTPKTLVTKYARASSNKSMMKYYTDEKFVVISTECPACHHTKSEIEKFFKEGKSVSMGEAARKAKELGLPMKI